MLNVAEPLQPYENESEESISNDDFDGDIIKATFNDIDLLEEVRLRQKDRTSSEERSEGQRLKHRKVKSTTVWFDTNEGHLAFSLYRNTTQNGIKLALKFRTLSKKCLIFIIWNEKVVGNEQISLQLINGQLRLTRISGSQLSTSTIKGKRWNDLKWHTLHLIETSKGGLKASIENKSAEIDGTLPTFRSAGKLFLGGLPTGTSWPQGIPQSEGFRGCMAALKFGNELLDLWSDAESGVQVEKGCRG
uniref:Laminin G domain-containing protein n=1 Tax=Panagrolaimus superbus TaxID=310955 RepID=A0A914XVT8_9BILA